MCDYFSGIITKGGKVLIDDSHSHSKIKDKYNLNDKKNFQDFLLFEIKLKEGKEEFDKPTGDSFKLLFQNGGGQGTFEIPVWYRATFDRKIWSIFKDIQNKKIKEHKLEEAKKEEEGVSKTIPKFRICLAEPSYLKNSIDILNEITSEVKFEVKKDMIQVVEMDPANVALVVWKLLSSVATEWDVKKEFSFALNIMNLKRILKNVKDSDMIELTNSKTEPDKLSVWFRGRSRREYTVPVILDFNSDNKIPDLKFNASVIMPSRTFEEQIKEAGDLAESVLFEVSKNLFELKAESDIDKLRIENKDDDDVTVKNTGEVRTKYSIEYLLKFAKSRKISDQVILQFSKDYPLKATYRLVDKLSFEWILAPRVEGV